VVSFGTLGVLGRIGWFCHETDVERWNALAGYRGLKNEAVQRYFNATFLAFERGWGDKEELLMTNLGLPYAVAYLGADAAAETIRERLDAGVPTLFYLWSPHQFNVRYSLNRIQLPAYSPKRFEHGLSDYPTDVLEKVASKRLGEFAAAVAELYSQFQMSNLAQENILDAVDSGQSTMQAACSWLRETENMAVWEAWVPVEKFACDPGHYALDAASCAACPPGSTSIGGMVTACVPCLAGTAWSRSHSHGSALFLFPPIQPVYGGTAFATELVLDGIEAEAPSWA
jgi:hypothetical protein